jgi:hypothetical protein
MFSKLLKLIKETNGDVFGVLLFISILTYLFLKNPPKEFKIALMIGCSLALAVDGYIVVKTLRSFKKLK